MERKGQAAMEFLMTYGWAILAAVIAIGVLAYFGVFSPGKYMAGTAIVSPPFYVNAENVKASGGVTLELKNNGGETYTVTAVAVSGCTGTTTLTPTTGSVAVGSTMTANIVCSPALTVTNSFKGDITITYRKSGSTTDLTSTGTISEKVV